jgi:hypothetical protein
MYVDISENAIYILYEQLDDIIKLLHDVTIEMDYFNFISWVVTTCFDVIG